MDKQRIEIFPGHWIEITPKIRNMAGLRKKEKVIARLADITKSVERAIPTGKNIKYSQLLKDEAVRIANAEGMRAAVKATGVNKHTILMERRLQNIRAGKKQTRQKGFAYTLEQKQACVSIALQLMRSKEMVEVQQRAGIAKKMVTVRRFKWSPKSAFDEAARRLGMNGRAIQFQWSIGAIPMPQSSTQHPSGL